MPEIELTKVVCPRCGGKLEKNNRYEYHCLYCDHVWEKECILSYQEQICDAITHVFDEERIKNIARQNGFYMKQPVKTISLHFM